MKRFTVAPAGAVNRVEISDRSLNTARGEVNNAIGPFAVRLGRCPVLDYLGLDSVRIFWEPSTGSPTRSRAGLLRRGETVHIELDHGGDWVGLAKHCRS